MFHMATKSYVPRTGWNKDSPSFHTSDLSEENKDVITQFSLPNVTYIGSDSCCGCGFKHALIHGRQWLPVIDNEDSADIINNQIQLFNFIKNNLFDQEFVEIYGCWDGDFADQPEDKQEIALNDILEPDFYFKEGMLYIVKINNNC